MSYILYIFYILSECHISSYHNIFKIHKFLSMSEVKIL